jgi:hypothetical protein
MREHVRRYAFLSVARGCGFGALTIVTAMAGSAFDLAIALKVCGFGFLLMCFVLIIKAARADQVPMKRTEVWIMMEPAERPPEKLAAVWIAAARREALYRFAHASAVIASLSLGGAVLLFLARNA